MQPMNTYLARKLAQLKAITGIGLFMSASGILLVALATGIAVLVFINSAPPTTITIASGPKGSSYQNNAEKYKTILAKQGITANIIPSEGSMDNLRMLSNPAIKVDVGFVMGGEVGSTDIEHLMSLGNVAYQPLMIFYRGKPKKLLSDFRRHRLDIDQEGSGTHTLALALLKANGIVPNDGTTLLSTGDDPVKALLENRIDAVFLMSDSTSIDTIRALLHNPDVHLFNFTQAEGYTRRIEYLNMLEIPRGALDFGKDIPPADLNLVGPTVELIARDSLHPALSDVLLEAAQEVHGKPGLYKKRGEFPNPAEHEFRISKDASRYYASGKSFLYRTFPFWIASLISRALEAIVPVVILLVPALKIAPAVYRWRIRSRIYRWYRALLELERNAIRSSFDPARRDEFLQQLESIEDAANRIVVPAAFGDLLYELRLHINFVRGNLLSKNA
ncbi:hypothetical protein GALL_25040 [mine drainage metagenome]|uniref:NMT1/THI5 like protein n=1 Tax=mine drainage metagenome TaxID=410659 RepID=A0A1J5TMC9_9ZZZZ